MTPLEGIGFSFHHVGVACTDIREEAKQLSALGYAPESDVFEDATQGVRGRFVIGPTPRLELLEPLNSSRPGVLAPWLAHGIKLYHLGYEVPDLAQAIATMRLRRGKLIASPVPAVAFEGRPIAFVMLPNRLLIELISAK